MDRWIYEFIDGWAAYFQTKRGWNLAKAKVWNRFAMMIFALAHANTFHGNGERIFFLLFNGTMFGLGLMAEIVFCFKQDADYPENVRKCERLNMKALAHREESWRFRTFGLGALLILLGAITIAEVLNFFFKGEADVAGMVITYAWYVAIILGPYLDCCFYLGPGKHSRELNKQEATHAATEKSS